MRACCVHLSCGYMCPCTQICRPEQTVACTQLQQPLLYAWRQALNWNLSIWDWASSALLPLSSHVQLFAQVLAVQVQLAEKAHLPTEPGVQPLVLQM